MTGSYAGHTNKYIDEMISRVLAMWWLAHGGALSVTQ